MKDCELKCDEDPKICSRACFGPPTCVCDDGLYRDKWGFCVEEDECDDMEIITFPPGVQV
ncbi:hypothetical protein ANCCEY_12491 [Ancylostoma ceylanicum]|uniref:TIL domain-containing protein n=1 Tax=Ancylostoma ceylanicum TaxID=53326 RepID=A0A0D6LB13_9BILA|nr:hypothetical protein ANCCEY_12491 [Ancylostoma ceylanicum]